MKVATLLVAALIAHGTAFASDESRREAAERYEQARRAYGEADYETALRHFEAADRAVPHDKSKLGIASCHLELGRFLEARELFEALQDSDRLGAEDLEFVQIQLRKLPSVIATLVVHGEPTGRVVAIDGEPRCEVPCRVEVDPGHHLVQVGELQRALRVDPGAVLEIEVNDVTRPVSPLVVDGPAASTPNRRTQPGSLTWIGTGVLAAGAIGALAFGLRTAQLHDRYEADPTRATRNRGVVMRSMLYTSIGVAALGSALLVIDLAIVGPRRARLPRRLGLTAHGWSVRF